MEFNATFIVSAISFIVFTLIMNAIFYGPLQKVVSERQKFVDDTLSEAKFNREKSESIIKDKENKLSRARHDAKKILQDKAETTKSSNSSSLQQAQDKSNQRIDEAKKQLEISEAEAKTVLDDEAKKLAELISAKILG